MAIYVHRNDQQLGPYTVAEVKSQLASGALSLTDSVRWKGQPGWVPLGGSAVLTPGFVDPEVKTAGRANELTGLSQFSVAALVAGVLFPFSFFTSIPAIVFGHCALKELRENPRRTGRRMAIAGMSLGYFFTVVGLIVGGLWFYFRDNVEAVQMRDAVVHSDRFVPPLPTRTQPAKAPALVNPPTVGTNADQPIAPAADAATNTASPATNAPPRP